LFSTRIYAILGCNNRDVTRQKLLTSDEVGDSTLFFETPDDNEVRSVYARVTEVGRVEPVQLEQKQTVGGATMRGDVQEAEILRKCRSSCTAREKKSRVPD